VIDNFGDAGVCWRLARQLALEHRASARLFIDRPELVQRLDPACGQVAGFSLNPWPCDTGDEPPEIGRQEPPDVIVSAFGCELPDPVRRMLAGAPAWPRWINLEYLSAESWIDGCHGLASTKPSDGAIEHFFFPGFTPASGGLLRERDAVRQGPPPDAPARREACLRLYGFAPAAGERLITLFCYPDAPIEAWLPALASGARPTLLVVPQGVGGSAIEAFAGPLQTGCPVAIPGSLLRIVRVPFLPQRDYDRILALSDFNFVRGEDSWIRAHWARRPFVWQPYPQEATTRRIKLEAFLERFVSAGSAGGFACAAREVAVMMRAWSGDGDPAGAWLALERADDPVARAFEPWVDSLLSQPDLAERLTDCVDRRL
jgi:uncharacterized repeat protein (TIGR03837 family)